MDKWAVHLFWRSGMTPVDFCVYVAFSYEAAFDFAHELPFVSNKKRGWFVKPWGQKKGRQYQYRPPKVEEAPPPPKPEAPPILLPAPQRIKEIAQQIKMWDDEQWQERQNKRRL